MNKWEAIKAMVEDGIYVSQYGHIRRFNGKSMQFEVWNHLNNKWMQSTILMDIDTDEPFQVCPDPSNPKESDRLWADFKLKHMNGYYDEMKKSICLDVVLTRDRELLNIAKAEIMEALAEQKK